MKARHPEATLHVLPGGLRLVHLHLPQAASGITGVMARTGSANDPAGHEGLAHFVEHTIFKGTAKRSSWHIINRMESVGGELNAYTTKEETVVYSIFPCGESARAIELIGDLVINSRFPERELEKEREVVGDEIDSYRDQPAEAVFDDFDDLIFAGTPLGHNILGTRESLSCFTPELCRRYLTRHFNVRDMVVFYCGPRNSEAVARLVERPFAGLPAGEGPVLEYALPEPKVFTETHFIDSHQAHVVGGCTMAGIYSPQRHATALLTNILGGPGMNSLLNVELREHRGLVYSAEASSTMYTAGGLLSIYYGCDPEDAGRCHKLVLRTIESVADGSALSPRRFEMAAKQYLGQLNIAAENRESRILSAARSVLFRGGCATMNEVFENIRSVRREDVMTLAGELRVNYCELSLRPRS